MDPFPESESNDHPDVFAEFELSPDSDSRPAPQFRNDLQRALEQTHRQQTARRTLGAHISDYQQELAKQRRQRRTLSLLAFLFILVVWLWRRSRQDL